MIRGTLWKFPKRYHLLVPHAFEFYQKPPHVPHKNTNSDPHPPVATSILSAAFETTYENRKRKATTTTAIAPGRENPFMSIEKNLETQNLFAWLIWPLIPNLKCTHQKNKHCSQRFCCNMKKVSVVKFWLKYTTRPEWQHLGSGTTTTSQDNHVTTFWQLAVVQKY